MRKKPKLKSQEIVRIRANVWYKIKAVCVYWVSHVYKYKNGFLSCRASVLTTVVVVSVYALTITEKCDKLLYIYIWIYMCERVSSKSNVEYEWVASSDVCNRKVLRLPLLKCEYDFDKWQNDEIKKIVEISVRRRKSTCGSVLCAMLTLAPRLCYQNL